MYYSKTNIMISCLAFFMQLCYTTYAQEETLSTEDKGVNLNYRVGINIPRFDKYVISHDGFVIQDISVLTSPSLGFGGYYVFNMNKTFSFPLGLYFEETMYRFKGYMGEHWLIHRGNSTFFNSVSRITVGGYIRLNNKPNSHLFSFFSLGVHTNTINWHKLYGSGYELFFYYADFFSSSIVDVQIGLKPFKNESYLITLDCTLLEIYTHRRLLSNSDGFGSDEDTILIAPGSLHDNVSIVLIKTF